MKIMVDPPSGWKYGFPKEFDTYRDGDMRAWLVTNGYPEEMITNLKSAFTVRTWAVAESTPDFIQGIPTIV